MGGGASVDQPNEDSDLIVNLYTEVMKLEQEIITNDITVFREQSKLTFKKHKEVIIKLITNRSKDYLIRLIKQYGSKDYKLLLNDSMFGKLLILLTTSVKEIDLEHLKLSIQGIGINEIAVGILLALKDSLEIKEISEAFEKRYKCSLLSKIQGKVRKDTCNETFFTSLLSCNRDTTSITNIDAANSTVDYLTLLLKSKNYDIKKEDSDTVVNTLISINRSQCKLISDLYLKKNDITLEKSIDAVFPRPIALALNIWTKPLGEAVGYLLLNAPDDEFIIYYISRLDKVFLQDQVTNDHKREYINKLKGNFKVAIESWFMEPYGNTPDLGQTDKIRNYIKDQRNTTKLTLEEMISTKNDQYNIIKFYLEEAISSLNDFIKNNSIKADPVEGHISSLHKKKAEAHPDDHAMIQLQYEEKLNLVTGYLRLQFDTYDVIGEGVVSADEFWEFMSVIPFEKYLHLTSEEVSLIKEATDWDSDGNISFDEVNAELADYMITALDQLEDGKSFEDRVNYLYDLASDEQQSVKKSRKAIVIESSNSNSSSSDGPVRSNGSLAPDLLSYLQITFAEYDTDESGSLELNEFWYLIQAMNLNISSSDYETIMQEFDTSSDGKVNWQEAIKQFNVILHDLASDSRDHWIGLVDKDTRLLYWYNIRDGSSLWMSEEDQQNYQAATHKEYVLPSIKIRSKKIFQSSKKSSKTPKSHINHWLISDDVNPNDEEKLLWAG